MLTWVELDKLPAAGQHLPGQPSDSIWYALAHSLLHLGVSAAVKVVPVLAIKPCK